MNPHWLRPGYVMGLRIVIVPAAYFPQEQYATSLYVARVHPFWRWLYGKWGRPEWQYEIIRGWSRRLYRPKTEAVRMGDALYCTKRFADELRRVPALS